MFGFIKKCFFTGLGFLWALTSVNSLSCISMKKQECKAWLQIFNVNSNEPCFILSVLKQVNVVVVATISMIYMQNCVFFILLKF